LDNLLFRSLDNAYMKGINIETRATSLMKPDTRATMNKFKVMSRYSLFTNLPKSSASLSRNPDSSRVLLILTSSPS
jgi:hypothetical protein